jgi:NAD(P)-dependent dehydrogenase (short-subunit alcohol dehydrogenase family)
MDDKVVAISGAAGNLGRVVTAKFLEEGWKVIAIKGVNSNFEWPRHTKLEVITLDLTLENMVKSFIEEVYAKYGKVNAALFLAGGFAMGGIEDTQISDLEIMIRLNFETCYLLSKGLFEKMKAQNQAGRFIFVGAKPALEPELGKDMMAYALSKSLVINYVRMLNQAGKDYGISSSVVVPGIIDTPENRKGMPDADYAQWVKPMEIAELMAFICSEKAKSITEEVVRIYGGKGK